MDTLVLQENNVRKWAAVHTAMKLRVLQIMVNSYSTINFCRRTALHVSF